MSGVILAFKDFKVKLGIFGSPGLGLKYFGKVFRKLQFFPVIEKYNWNQSVYAADWFSDSHYIRTSFKLFKAQASEKNAADGFLRSLFYFHGSYLRYDRYFYG